MNTFVQLISEALKKRPVALMSFFRGLTQGRRAPRTLEPYDWWNYVAPVCPPTSVIKAVRETGRSTDWQNVFWDGVAAAAIFYRTRPVPTEENEDGYITHVLPGSYVVSKIHWLKRSPTANSRPNQGTKKPALRAGFFIRGRRGRRRR